MEQHYNNVRNVCRREAVQIHGARSQSYHAVRTPLAHWASCHWEKFILANSPLKIKAAGAVRASGRGCLGCLHVAINSVRWEACCLCVCYSEPPKSGNTAKRLEANYFL